MEKTHYRKVFKSDHLGIADLEDLIEEGKRLVFTVKEVKQFLMIPGDKNSGVVVAGNRIGANVAYFKEPIKPMVLNATNSKIMKSFNNGSPFVEDWNNTIIELYIDPNVKMKGDVVGGVRIKPTKPAATKPELVPTMTDEWNRAITHLKGTGTIVDIKKRYSLSATNEQLLKDAVL